jgi:hypothetical protein
MTAYFYSPNTGGFYREDVHGDNMPLDVVEVAGEEHAALMAGQAIGKSIQANEQGLPVLVDPPAPSAADVIKQSIGTLESSVTPRRVREAILGIDNGWLQSVDAQIVALRAQL